jgi:hypothetical protein
MKLCPQCNGSPLPFVMVLFMASLLAFVTWLMLTFAGADPLQAAVGTAVAFVAVGATMLHYVLACMKRHCPHGGNRVSGPHSHHHGTLG